MTEITSTNTVLAQRARAGEPHGAVLVADLQTRGKGRRDRSWETPRGEALLVSVLVRPSALDNPEALTNPHRLTQAMSLAACQAAREAGVQATIKWPNDLLVEGAKLAGILAEAVGAAEAVVIGMGCNVRSAPEGAAYLDAYSGAPVDRRAFLAATLSHLGRHLSSLETIDEAYREACSTIGRRIRVETQSGWEEGLATGVDRAGRLLWTDSKGIAGALSAGDVVHVRPAGGTW